MVAATKAPALSCPWVLTGPWYRWSSPGEHISGRLSRPIFQKYDTSDFINEFLKNPQRSLKFVQPDDVVSDGSGYSHRKIYLDTHKRFYLVVCELHCDLPGLPKPCRNQVCEAGFVVRRRSARVPSWASAELARRMREIAALEAQIAKWIEPLPGAKTKVQHALAAELQEKHAKVQAEFDTAVNQYGISLVLEGWIPSGFDKIGAWQTVQETPAEISEHIFPLYPLIPDPKLTKHAGAGRDIYFGLLPASSLDADKTGAARFDDRHLYEVRCFVRRHKSGCAKKLTRNDCHGQVVWSRRTESYQLASHFDLSGTSNRPVTIQMPDLRALKKEAEALPPGAGAPVRVISPPESFLSFNVDTADGKASASGSPRAAICSFSIPLITIVAMFVFRLFLPIVVFLFGLFFLLRLKFCIPPTFDLSLDVSAKLAAHADAEIDAQFDAALDANLKAVFGNTDGATMAASFTPREKAEFVAAVSADLSASAPEDLQLPAGTGAPAPKATIPSLTATLIWEDEVPVL